MTEMGRRGNEKQQPGQGAEEQCGLGLVDVDHVFDDDGQKTQCYQNQ